MLKINLLKSMKNYRNTFRTSQFINFNAWASLHTREFQGQDNKAVVLQSYVNQTLINIQVNFFPSPEFLKVTLSLFPTTVSIFFCSVYPTHSSAGRH